MPLLLSSSPHDLKRSWTRGLPGELVLAVLRGRLGQRQRASFLGRIAARRPRRAVLFGIRAIVQGLWFRQLREDWLQKETQLYSLNHHRRRIVHFASAITMFPL